MLPEPTVPPPLMALLENLGMFTSPSPCTFTVLPTRPLAATGKHRVTGLLTATGR
jgi:hypothetical protein